MRALVIEHDPLSTPERVGAHLERRGATLEPFVVVEDIRDPAVSATFPENGSHDLVVLMGSPWSVYEDRVQGWVVPELEFIRRQVSSGIPVLGICFGAQAMSAALGGQVTRSARPEYGWVSIDSDADPIAPGPWFQYHHDEFTLPPGGVELARNPSGLQAFRIGRNLAVQFHPEMTASLISSWSEVDGAVEMVEAGIDPDQVIEESRLLERTTQPALERMLDWFLDEIAGAG
ncbi:MAG: type 1 glutamine amidotransferase [Actinomycetota bacterium]|nr:type 1 glutamine amidotransferase [Actinomycetota bacterium]